MPPGSLSRPGEAAWVLSRRASGRDDPREGFERCRRCRRPEGEQVLAWRDGRWAVPAREAFAFFWPDGTPLIDSKQVDRLLTDPDWRIVRVVLDLDGYCPRCAHLVAHPHRA